MEQVNLGDVQFITPEVVLPRIDVLALGNNILEKLIAKGILNIVRYYEGFPNLGTKVKVPAFAYTRTDKGAGIFRSMIDGGQLDLQHLVDFGFSISEDELARLDLTLKERQMALIIGLCQKTDPRSASEYVPDPLGELAEIENETRARNALIMSGRL
ncbi:MAG: hypothetical protein AAB373_04670 [Patescibacteria group bacterium]